MSIVVLRVELLIISVLERHMVLGILDALSINQKVSHNKCAKEFTPHTCSHHAERALHYGYIPRRKYEPLLASFRMCWSVVLMDKLRRATPLLKIKNVHYTKDLSQASCIRCVVHNVILEHMYDICIKYPTCTLDGWLTMDI